MSQSRDYCAYISLTDFYTPAASKFGCGRKMLYLCTVKSQGLLRLAIELAPTKSAHWNRPFCALPKSGKRRPDVVRRNKHLIPQKTLQNYGKRQHCISGESPQEREHRVEGLRLPWLPSAPRVAWATGQSRFERTKPNGWKLTGRATSKKSKSQGIIAVPWDFL